MSFIKDILDRLHGAVRTLVEIPKEERENYRAVLDETFKLLDTTITMIIIRLGDLLNIENNNQQFIQEVAYLDNFGEWITIERSLRVCSALRAALRETNTFRGRLIGKASTENWDELLKTMNEVLNSESVVAESIQAMFKEVSDLARSGEATEKIRKMIRESRESLDKERQRLIKLERDMYSII